MPVHLGFSRRADLQCFTIKPSDISFKLVLHVNVVFMLLLDGPSLNAHAGGARPGRTHRSNRQILSELVLSVNSHHTTPDVFHNLGKTNQCSYISLCNGLEIPEDARVARFCLSSARGDSRLGHTHPVSCTCIAAAEC